MNKLYEFFKEKIYELAFYRYRSVTEEEEKMLELLQLFETSCRLMIEAYEDEKEPKERISIGNLGLTERAKNCLLRAGYRTLDDVVNSSIIDLMKIRNLGRKTLKEIKCVVKEHGYTIPEER